jgi:putative peptidoglycan lipid II flippase
VRLTLIRVALLTVFAQGAGFLKTLLVAHYFGVGADLDGYYLALVAPTLLAGIVGGALQTGFFPVHARLRAEGRFEEACDLQSALLWLLLSISLAASVIMAAASGGITKLMAAEASARVMAAANLSLKVVAFAFALNAIADYLGFVLAAYFRFALAAAAPAVNALIGGLFLYAWPQLELYNLVWGTILGILVQVLVLVFAARKVGVRWVVPWRLSPGWITPVRETAKLGVWILPGVFFANLSAALPQVLAAEFGEGGISAFGYANRLHGAMVQVLVMSLSTVLVARFSKQIAFGQEKQLARTLARGFPLALGIGLLVPVWVWAAGPDVLRLLFEHGRFDAAAVSQVYGLWFWLALGFFPAVWGVILAKVFQAWRRPGFITLLAFLGLTVLWVSSRMLAEWIGVSSVACAVGLSLLSTALLYHIELLRTFRSKAVSFVLSWQSIRFSIVTLLVVSAIVVASRISMWQEWQNARFFIVSVVTVAGAYWIFLGATRGPGLKRDLNGSIN